MAHPSAFRRPPEEPAAHAAWAAAAEVFVERWAKVVLAGILLGAIVVDLFIFWMMRDRVAEFFGLR